MQLWDLFGIFVYKALYINKFRDEARHGKAFEGLLKRYFND